MNQKLNTNWLLLSVTMLASAAVALAMALRSAATLWFETMFQVSQIYPG